MFDLMEEESELEIFERIEALHDRYEERLERLWMSIKEFTEGEQ